MSQLCSGTACQIYGYTPINLCAILHEFCSTGVLDKAWSHLPMTRVSSASQHKSLPMYALAAILAIPKRLLNLVSSTLIICMAMGYLLQ